MFNIKINEIHNSLNTNSGYFQQTPFWGEFKSHHNWKNLRFNLEIQYPADEEEQDCNHNQSLLRL